MAADDAFDDDVIGGSGGAKAYAEVDLPFGGDVEVGDGEYLLLLIVQSVKISEAAVVGVVLEASVDLLGEVIADFGAGGKPQALIDVGTVPGTARARG